jgi:hypothetical protein
MDTRIVFLLTASALLLPLLAEAQPAGFNYDEAKVPQYTLPDALVLSDGTRVTDAKTWVAKRRPEILKMFETEVYGRNPGRSPKTISEVLSVDEHALGGKAIRKQVAVYFSGKKDGPKMEILIYLPAGATKPVRRGLPSWKRQPLRPANSVSCGCRSRSLRKHWIASPP